MPCAASVRCKLPGQTPGSPAYTIHKYAEIAESFSILGAAAEKSRIFDHMLLIFFGRRRCPINSIYGGDSNKKAKQTDDYYYYYYLRT